MGNAAQNKGNGGARLTYTIIRNTHTDGPLSLHAQKCRRVKVVVGCSVVKATPVEVVSGLV
jgi:hypothetical protein